MRVYNFFSVTNCYSPTANPTSSPLFDSNDGCIDITPTCEDDVEKSKLEWGLLRDEACCDSGGGYLPMMDIISKEKTERITTDLEFDTDFTYSFWVEITNDNNLEQILLLEYSFDDDEPIIEHNFIGVKDQRVVVSLFLGHQNRSLENNNDNFECSSPELSSTHAK